jgi:hypothetical protein
MTVPRERLMAFVDGELSEDEARGVAIEVARDPELLRYVEEQKALRSALSSAFAPILAEPVPLAIERAVRETPVPVRKSFFESTILDRVRRAWEAQSPAMRLSWAPAGAMAAGIVLGILLASSFGSTTMRDRNGALFAEGDLARTLTERLAADNTGADVERVGISFFSKDGLFCRSFTTGAASNRLSGIACREGNDWRIATVAVAPAPVQASGTFSTAGADMPASVRSALNEMIAGEPLDAAAERAAKNQGWRAR